MPSTTISLLKELLEELDLGLELGEATEDTLLFDGGLEMDSFAVVELISLIETRMGFEFTEADFEPENFVSLGSIAKVVTVRAPDNAATGQAN